MRSQIQSALIVIWALEEGCATAVTTEEVSRPVENDAGRDELTVIDCLDMPVPAEVDLHCTLTSTLGDAGDQLAPCDWRCEQDSHVWTGSCDGGSCSCQYDDSLQCECTSSVNRCELPGHHELLDGGGACCSDEQTQ